MRCCSATKPYISVIRKDENVKKENDNGFYISANFKRSDSAYRPYRIRLRNLQNDHAPTRHVSQNS
jgi:hypothetical protein